MATLDIRHCNGRRFWFGLLMFLAFAGGARPALAGVGVEFDFPQSVVCRVVTPAELVERFPDKKIVEVVLRVSVRFHGEDQHAVEEITIEVDASESELQVHGFSPSTQLTSLLAKEIEISTTTEKMRSLDATLGGALPVPFANLAAHVTPSISSGISKREVATEKTSRLSPKQVLVVSGTLHQRQGVFFKLKRNSQSTLEGIHELTVSFLVPDPWQGDAIQIVCTASGHRKLLWLKQPKVWGRVNGTVELDLAEK